MKHTPAPWKFVIDGNNDGDVGIIVGDEGRRICDFGNGAPYYPCQGFAPNRDNLNLILAAPELLEALQGLADMYVELIGYWDAEKDQQVIAARSAIKKATGE